jgi:ribosomal-protein-alanine N-acetyltransferase
MQVIVMMFRQLSSCFQHLNAAGQMRIPLLKKQRLAAQNEILASFVGQDHMFWQQIVGAPRLGRILVKWPRCRHNIGVMSLIASQRLDLIPMSPAFLEASLAGDEVKAARLLELEIPADWFRERELIQLRLGQLRREPALQPWLLRAIGLRQQKHMIGHIGFHTGPDPSYLRDIARGAIEYGYTVFPAFRRQGYAREACAALMTWAFQEQRVEGFVVAIRLDNIASLRLAQSFGFKRIGSHVDEVDGLEDIYELRLSLAQADALLAHYCRPPSQTKATDQ